MSEADRNAKWKAVAKEAAKVIAVAAWKIITRMLAWGSAGLAAGVIVFVALLLSGLLDTPSPYSSYVRWAVLPVYLIAGAGLLGYAGFWRGIGRTLLHVGLERGMVATIVERILDSMVKTLRGSERVAATLDKGDAFLRNLPLQTAEDALKGAIHTYVSSDDMEEDLTGFRRRIARSVKRALTRRVEKYLLSFVRAQASESGGGGVSMDKVLALAPGKAQEAVGEMIQGFMGKQLLIMSALALVVFAVPPSVMALLR